MGSIGTILSQSAGLTLGYAARLLNGVDGKMFARFARPGGVEINSNHPAWAYGHLSLYPPRVLAHLGDAGALPIPPGFEDLFKNGAECRDDPTGTIYPAMSDIREFFFAGYTLATRRIADAPDELLAGPNPAEGRMRELFPTLGAMLNFYLSGHAQMHLGQVSAWRRAMGLPAA